jgi:hypothetical protein
MMTSVRRIMVRWGALLIGPLVACNRDAASALAPATLFVRGPVVEVRTGGGERMVGLVRVGPGAGARDVCGGISASVTTRTRVLRRTAAGGRERVGLDALTVGDTAEVYVTGNVTGRCEADGEADGIVLVWSARDG